MADTSRAQISPTSKPVCAAASRHKLSLLWAEPDAAQTIADLHGAAFSGAWKADAIAALLMADTAIAFVATMEQAHRPVGFVIGRLLVDEAEIVTIGVVPSARRKGVASALLEGFETAAANAGAVRVILDVSEANPAAQALYRGAGYGQIATRPAYYEEPDGTRTTATVLAKTLPPRMDTNVPPGHE